MPTANPIHNCKGKNANHTLHGTQTSHSRLRSHSPTLPIHSHHTAACAQLHTKTSKPFPTTAAKQQQPHRRCQLQNTHNLCSLHNPRTTLGRCIADTQRTTVQKCRICNTAQYSMSSPLASQMSMHSTAYPDLHTDGILKAALAPNNSNPTTATT